MWYFNRPNKSRSAAENNCACFIFFFSLWFIVKLQVVLFKIRFLRRPFSNRDYLNVPFCIPQRKNSHCLTQGVRTHTHRDTRAHTQRWRCTVHSLTAGTRRIDTHIKRINISWKVRVNFIFTNRLEDTELSRWNRGSLSTQDIHLVFPFPRQGMR